MKKMKVYAAVGHFKGCENMKAVAMKCNSKSNFVADLRGNEFVPYIVITENMLEKLKTMDNWELYKQVRKMTTNYRLWNDLADYLIQCLDFVEDIMDIERNY